MTSGSISLKGLRDTIEADLHSTGRVHDYCRYAQEVEEIIQTQSPDTEVKKYLLEALWNIKSKIDTKLLHNWTMHEHIGDVSIDCGETILNNWKNNLNNIHLIEEKLNSKFRTYINEYNIAKPLNNTHLYRWWVARFLARMHFGYELNKQDVDYSLADKDMIIQKPFSVEDLGNMYDTTPRWIKWLPIVNITSLKNEMQYVDLSINQVFVWRDTIYYTPQAKLDLFSHVARIVAQWADLYHTYEYSKNWSTIHGKNPLRRAFKFLIEDKVNGLEIMNHNIDKSNIASMDMDNEFLVLIRSIMGRDLGQETLYIWRYWLLLQ